MKKLIFLFALLLSAVAVTADSYEFEFSGYIDVIEANTNNALPGIYLNQPFHGWFSYSIVPDQTPNPDYGVYSQNASISTTLGTLDLDHIDDHIYIRVANDYTNGEDIFSHAVDASNGSFGFTKYGLYLTDSTGTVFNTGQLPVSFDLSQFDSRRFMLKGYSLPNTDWFDVEGEITSLTLVPEPITLASLFLGALFIRNKRTNGH